MIHLQIGQVYDVTFKRHYWYPDRIIIIKFFKGEVPTVRYKSYDSQGLLYQDTVKNVKHFLEKYYVLRSQPNQTPRQEHP